MIHKCSFYLQEIIKTNYDFLTIQIKFRNISLRFVSRSESGNDHYYYFSTCYSTFSFPTHRKDERMQDIDIMMCQDSHYPVLKLPHSLQEGSCHFNRKHHTLSKHRGKMLSRRPLQEWT